MKKLNKVMINILIIMLFFQSGSIAAKASDNATFYVQTAQALSDGTIQVSIYLDGVSSLGGIDAELFFDSEKVTFISSSIGNSLNSSMADINYDAENSKIHYVILYPTVTKAHGIIINAVFQLKEGQSYQPKLQINDLIDNSDDLKDIPYNIKYQQSDGKWEDSADESGTLAKEKIIENTLDEYGAPEDKDKEGNSGTVSVDSSNNVTGALTDSEAAADNPEVLLKTEDGKDTEHTTEDTATEETATEEMAAEETATEETETEPASSEIENTESKKEQSEGKTDRTAIIGCLGFAGLLILAECYMKWKRK